MLKWLTSQDGHAHVSIVMRARSYRPGLLSEVRRVQINGFPNIWWKILSEKNQSFKETIFS